MSAQPVLPAQAGIPNAPGSPPSRGRRQEDSPASCSCGTPPPEDTGCSGGESFALRVLGEDMLPEFREGDIIIVEPDGALKDGCYVLARPGGDWMLRQLVRRDAGWALRALNPAACTTAPELPLPDLSAVHGLVIQKAVPGRRRLTRSYV